MIPPSREPARAQRILLAEDDISLSALLTELLSEAGHSVVAVHGSDELEQTLIGAVANRRSVLERFDLLITDLRMPGPRTFDVLARLGTAGLRPPTLVLSAFADDSTLVEAYRIGCLCALAKPFDIRDLLIVIDLLGRTPSRTAA